MNWQKVYRIFLVLIILGTCFSACDNVTINDNQQPIIVDQQKPPTNPPIYNESDSIETKIGKQQAIVTYYTRRCNKHGLDCDKIETEKIKLRILLNNR